MSDLSEFLLTRIAEDQAAAQAEWDWMIERHGPDAWTTGEGAPIEREWAYETDRDWTLHVSPRRILAECEAKRRIVEDATQGGDCQGHPGSYQPHGEYGPGYCRDFSDNQYLRLLALPYADHPDWREEWRP